MKLKTPTAPGFYWAKHGISNEDWRIVEVYHNGDKLVVYEMGVEKEAYLRAFVWYSGKKIGMQ